MGHSTVNMAITNGSYKAADMIWRQAEENSFYEFYVLEFIGRKIIRKKLITIICQTCK